LQVAALPHVKELSTELNNNPTLRKSVSFMTDPCVSHSF